jgi:hypothetical protein
MIKIRVHDSHYDIFKRAFKIERDYDIRLIAGRASAPLVQRCLSCMQMSIIVLLELDAAVLSA